jgi:MurNAc alpha-1-phosphate uridylyltransferase
MGSPKTAMVLAAGLGTRMQPLSHTVPKPLVQVGGLALIDRCLDGLADAGIETAVVNVNHLADKVEAHLSRRTVPKIVISDERGLLLETGGGIRKALPLLGREPFLLRNSDSMWVEGVRRNLDSLMRGWDEARMDCLLLLAATVGSWGYVGRGDFFLTRMGVWSAAASATSPPSLMPAPPSCIRASSRILRRARSPSTCSSTAPSGTGAYSGYASTACGSVWKRRLPSPLPSTPSPQAPPEGTMPSRNVFTIPPGAPFLDTLAGAILDGRLVGGVPLREQPFALADLTLYLPTRRAARAVRASFLHAGGPADPAAPHPHAGRHRRG